MEGNKIFSTPFKSVIITEGIYINPCFPSTLEVILNRANTLMKFDLPGEYKITVEYFPHKFGNKKVHNET